MPPALPILYTTPNCGIEVVREYPPGRGVPYVKCLIRPHALMVGTVVQRSRLRMTDAVGRKLGRWEIVHHKNEDKTDDSVANLFILPIGDHNREHRAGVKQSAATIAKKAAGMRDAYARGAFKHVSRAGESSGNAKLTWEQVQEIRRQRATGKPNGEVAAAFNVSAATVSMIHNNRIWRKPA